MSLPTKPSPSIKDWSADDQPRFKLKQHGSQILSNAELLAILIGSGSREESAVDLCKRILKSMDGDLDRLARMSLSELQQYKGIGEAKAITISAALELGRRRQHTSKEQKLVVRDSRSAYQVMAGMLADKVQEEFWVAYLDQANTVIERQCVSRGGVAGTVVDPRLVFKEGLQLLASGLILYHNHPSGQLKPSKADIQLTKRLSDGAKILQMRVLDHIIVGGQQYFSFADEGML